MEKNDYTWIAAQAPWLMTQGHLAYDWDAIITLGLQAFWDKADALLNRETDTKKREFYEGACLIIGALQSFIVRFGNIAKKAGDVKTGESIIRLAKEPPQTLFEAMQLIRLIIFAVRRVIGFSTICMGHMDRYFFPFL